MQILDVESGLNKNEAAKPLKLASPDALNPNRELYTVVPLQPHGRLEATIKRIGHADQTGAAQMCTRFLDLATETQGDLVVAPEYWFRGRWLTRSSLGACDPAWEQFG